MIPERIKALFQFIDFLDSNKETYINTYLPIVEELETLMLERNRLKPEENYKERIRYAEVQEVLSQKFNLVYENVTVPFNNKLMELGIWGGEDFYKSISYLNIDSVDKLKKNFSIEDVKTIQAKKEKYINFRAETNSNFLSLQFAFEYLDEVLKSLFDYFKDVQFNEFGKFENEGIQVESLAEAVQELQKGNSKIVLPFDFLLRSEQSLKKPELIEEKEQESCSEFSAKEKALAYIFDLYSIGKKVPMNRIEGGYNKKELEKIGENEMNEKGDTFYRAVKAVLKFDLNKEQDLKNISQDWFNSVKQLSKNWETTAAYLKEKRLFRED